MSELFLSATNIRVIFLFSSFIERKFRFWGIFYEKIGIVMKANGLGVINKEERIKEKTISLFNRRKDDSFYVGLL